MIGSYPIKIKPVLSIILFVTLCFSLVSNAYPAPNPKQEAGKLPHFKIVIPVQQLESLGFESFSPSDFDIVFHKESLYLFNYKDRRIVKFPGNKPGKTVAAEEGNERGKMLSPKSFFIYDSKTAAVYDYERKTILFYDLNLNFIDEKKIEGNYSDIAVSDTRIIAFTPNDSHVAAFLDSRFKTAGKLVKAHKEIPFPGFYPRLSNQVYFMKDGLAAHTPWLQTRKMCKIEIYDLKKRRPAPILSLSWKQPYEVDMSSFERRLDLYFTSSAVKTGPFYVVQNSVVRSIGELAYDLLVFNADGTLRHRTEFPYRFIRCQTDSREKDGVFYALDDESNIVGIELGDLLKFTSKRRVLKERVKDTEAGQSVPVRNGVKKKSGPNEMDPVLSICEGFCDKYRDESDFMACIFGCLGAKKK